MPANRPPKREATPGKLSRLTGEITSIESQLRKARKDGDGHAVARLQGELREAHDKRARYTRELEGAQ